MMYSVSYFCTKMHRFKAKLQKFSPPPLVAFGHSFVRPTLTLTNEIPDYFKFNNIACLHACLL